MSEELKLLRGWIKSPTKWVESMFGLVPQKLKEGYVVGKNTRLGDIKASWFEEFKKGENLTWQQWVILLAVERAVNREGPGFISISAGRGVGKSSVVAIVLLWYLLNYKDAQIPCTAPSAQHMYDVLWKEVAKWHGKLPQNFKDKIEVESSYIRFKESPLTWYARAATARKERPEALSGVHSDNVMLVADEASAIADEVFDIGVGSLTNKNPLMILISNYTRTSGYFHRSQENTHGEFEVLRFNAEESPVVDIESIERQKRNGLDSTEYRVNVLGLPPKVGVEIKGYVPLLMKDDLRFTSMGALVQPIVMGVDPSGQGRNKTAIVLRDPFRAVMAGKWADLRPNQIAKKVCEIADELKILPENIIIDSFGVGASVLNEFLLLKRYVQGVLIGDPASEKSRYVNIKAEMYWRLREWILKGGELVGNLSQWEELLSIRYYSEISKIKIMGKKTMAENGLLSPDLSDALSLTFLREYYETHKGEDETEVERFDPYGGL